MKKVLLGLLGALTLICFFSFKSSTRVSAQGLPDLTYTNFSACWRYKAGNPNRTEVVMYANQKNIGTAQANAHLFGAFANYDSLRYGPQCAGSTIWAVTPNTPALNPNEEFPMATGGPYGDFPASCALAGGIVAGVSVDPAYQVAESNESNNAKMVGSVFGAIPQCSYPAISCTASFNPSSGAVKAGQFEAKNKNQTWNNRVECSGGAKVLVK